MPIRRDDLKLCNCAECGAELASQSHSTSYMIAESRGQKISDLPPLVRGRINGRPFCGNCLNYKTPPQLAESLTPRQRDALKKTSS